jgi:hypothetical protein
MDNLAKTYPVAEKIVVVLDNLNTHSLNNFYQVFDADKACQPAQKFEFVYTPKSAGWLNLIERGGPSHRIFGAFKTMP